MNDQATQPTGPDEGSEFTVVASLDDADTRGLIVGHSHVVHPGHIHAFASEDCDDVEGHGHCTRGCG